MGSSAPEVGGLEEGQHRLPNWTANRERKEWGERNWLSRNLGETAQGVTYTKPDSRKTRWKEQRSNDGRTAQTPNHRPRKLRAYPSRTTLGQITSKLQKMKRKSWKKLWAEWEERHTVPAAEQDDELHRTSQERLSQQGESGMRDLKCPSKKTTTNLEFYTNRTILQKWKGNKGLVWSTRNNQGSSQAEGTWHRSETWILIMKGSVSPDQGWNPCPLQWKHRALPSGLRGKSPDLFFFLFLVHLKKSIYNIIIGNALGCGTHRRWHEWHSIARVWEPLPWGTCTSKVARLFEDGLRLVKNVYCKL